MTPERREEIAKMAATYDSNKRIKYIRKFVPLDAKEQKIILDLANYIDWEGE